jgi:hypothetical protein
MIGLITMIMKKTLNQDQLLLSYHSTPKQRIYIPREFSETEDGQKISPTEGLLELKQELSNLKNDGLSKYNDQFYFYLSNNITIADNAINFN